METMKKLTGVVKPRVINVETREPGIYYSESIDRNLMEDGMNEIREIIYLNPNIVPFTYVDQALLYAIESRGDEGSNKEPFILKMYGINGASFADLETDWKEEYIKFEIVDERRNECVKEEFFENAGEFVEADASHLALSIQDTHNGVIINSNVFLAEKNWHTIVEENGKHDICVVCATISNDYKSHIDSKEHKSNLQEHLPLDYYDLNIMRKVNGKYHCGVCNEINTPAQIHIHLSSKSHEHRLQAAINRVPEMIDLDDSPQHTSQPAIDIREEDNLEGFYDYPIQLANPNLTVQGYAAESDSDDSDEGPTYAAIARLPKKMPKCTEIDMGESKAWFQTDTWHMIVCPKPNKFYCMVCKIDGPIRMKTEHCIKKEHLENLGNCTLMKEYKHHLIRRVSSQLVHCGHCNNLRLVSDIDTHLEFRHRSRKSKTQTDTQKAKGTANSSPARSLTTVNSQSPARRASPANSASRASTPSPANPVNLPKSNAVAILPAQNKPTQSNKNLALQRNQTICLIHRIDHINNMMQIEIFGARMMIPTLHFHTVIYRDGFHCCICDLYISKEAIPDHLLCRSHLSMLKKTHFIVNLNLNLVRMVRDGFHCGICNALFPYNLILTHIGQYYHVSFLNNAVVPPRPDSHQMFIAPQPNNHINSPQHYINDANYPPQSYQQINTSSHSSYHANILPQLTNHSGSPQSSNQTNLSSPFSNHINNLPPSINPINIPPQSSNQRNILLRSNIPTNIPSQSSDLIKSSPQSSNPTNIPQPFSNQIKCLPQSSNPTNIPQPFSNQIKCLPQSSNPTYIPLPFSNPMKCTPQASDPTNHPPSSRNKRKMCKQSINQTTIFSEPSKPTNIPSQSSDQIKSPAQSKNPTNTPPPSSYLIKNPPQSTNQTNIGPQFSNTTNITSQSSDQNKFTPQFKNPTNTPPPSSNLIKNPPQSTNFTNTPSQSSDQINSAPQSSSHNNDPSNNQTKTLEQFSNQTTIPSQSGNPTNIHSQSSGQIKSPAQSSNSTNIPSLSSNLIKSRPQSSNPFSILDEESDNPDSLNDTDPQKDDISQSDIFDVEDFIYVKIDDAIFKIGACSYNTLVAIGDGNRHCFLCSETLSRPELGKHVSRRDHQENLEKTKFLDKRKTSLLRQQYIRYHCGVCNTIVLGRDLNSHLTWPLHVCNEQTASVTKKKEKKNMKDKKRYDLTLQKEEIYIDAAEPELRIRSFKFSKEAAKRYKVVVVKNCVAKIEWHAWHGFLRNGEGLRCCLCQTTVDGDPAEHTENEDHIYATKNFLKSYLPNLIRLTFGDKLNCVTCNYEIEKRDSVRGHLHSKCHKKTYKSIFESTSEAPRDCSTDVFSLDDEN